MRRAALLLLSSLGGLLVAWCFARGLPARAQSPAETPAAADAAPKNPIDERQEAIRVRFGRFEETLMKMARYLQKTEPARAELVMRALRRSKEERVTERMTLVTRMLSDDEQAVRYADAISEQEQILGSLKELITILRSEDILDDNRKEQERLKELAKQIAALIDSEKVHQAETRRGESTDKIAEGQRKTSDRTGDVIDDVDRHDQQKTADDRNREESGKGDDEGSEPQPGEEGSETEDGKPEDGGKPKENGKPNENGTPNENGHPNENAEPGESGEPQDSGKPNEGEKPSENGKPSEGGKPQEGGQPSQTGEQNQGQQQENQQNQSQQQTPGRQQLEQARQQMDRAIEELKKQQRENASGAQEEAIQKLIEAKEKVEELLRQLREEERELLLRALEARLQKMLQLQQVVLERTAPLAERAKDDWQDRDFHVCSETAAVEREIALEADKTLEVLKADGSSVAFPEAMTQLRQDIGDVATRLGRSESDKLTVAVERDIVEALEEMIVALQKEMQKMQDQKSQEGQQQQQGQPADPALVDKLAELRMLRTLQLRINRRTQLLGELIRGQDQVAPESVEKYRELAERQRRLQRATYDLATEKTTP